MVELKTTAELDKVAADVLAWHGAGSPFLNYHPRWAPTPFPAVLCVSVARPLVIAIEPMSPASGRCPQIATGTDGYTHDADGWTLRTASGARAGSPNEHTVAVTAKGPRILTS